MRILSLLLVVMSLPLGLAAQHERHDHAAMNARGEKAMGFSQTETTHRFRLLKDGGYVQVQANDADDTETRDRIRAHVRESKMKFAEGNFSAPELTHDRVPPGVETMTELKSVISYKYEEIERGARLSIRSRAPRAIAAIHEFLRFQIEDHKTGDDPAVKPN